MNAEAYVRQILQLLPRGRAWAGELIRSTTPAIADECARIDARAADLLEESDPRNALETLSEWESSVGLPDPCVADWSALTLDQRRAAVVTRLTGEKRASLPFFLDLLESLGYTATIKTYKPFQVGRNCIGDPLTNGGWVFAFTISGPGVDDEFLRCVIAKNIPAHNVALYDPT